MRRFVPLLSCFLLSSISYGIAIVDGLGGGPTTFASIDQAVDYCIASSTEDTIEIRTNGPIAGTDLVDKNLPRPLTIKAGNGFRPIINSTLYARPANESGTTVTFEGLRTELPDSSGYALRIGCNVVAINCEFYHPGSASRGYEAAVTAAYPTVSTDSQVYLTSCTIIGHNAIQAGRAARDYYLTSCTITAIDDLGRYAMAIVNNMNWPPNYGAEALEYSTALSLPPIAQPRNVTLNRCLVKAGQCIGWPADTLFPYHYANQNNAIGQLTAVNCVFDTPNAASNASTLDNTQLPDTNPCNASFYHCTMKRVPQYGFVYMRANPSVVFSNCLFDMPNVGNSDGYVIGPDGSFTGTVTGDRNAYNISAQGPTYGFIGNVRPNFESTNQYRRNSLNNTDYVTDAAGNFSSADQGFIAEKAIALVPLVSVDKDMEVRPQPASASANDIGADEILETNSRVQDWQLF